MQYFPKKKLILPEGYFLNSSQVPYPRDINRLLVSCGCESFSIKKLSLAIKKSNFFFAIENESKNKLLESDRDLRSSVNLRNKTIIPLGFLQVSLLRRLRDQSRQPPISEFLNCLLYTSPSPRD